MTTKHTPGPWQISVYHHINADTGQRYIEDADNEIICETYRGRHHDETLANARLIAAAPELLAFAQQCRTAIGLGNLHFRTEGVEINCVAALNAALTKAEG